LTLELSESIILIKIALKVGFIPKLATVGIIIRFCIKMVVLLIHGINVAML
jgi:hypothetical protein